MNASKPIIDRLRELLGDEDCIALLEIAAGTRLYISRPKSLADRVGEDIAAKLHEKYGREYLKVPLGRQFRAEYYNARGMSNAQIARLIGCTDGGVERMLNKPQTKRRKED